MILPEHIRRSLADQNTRTLKILSEADAQVVSGISQLEWDKKTRNGVCAVWYGTNLRLPNLAQARLLTDLPREYEVAYDGLQSLAPSLDSKFSLAWQERNRILAGNHHAVGIYRTPNGWRDGTCPDGFEYPLSDDFELDASKPDTTRTMSFITSPTVPETKRIASTAFIDEGYEGSDPDEPLDGFIDEGYAESEVDEPLAGLH